jgi:hypothetical protein
VFRQLCKAPNKGEENHRRAPSGRQVSLQGQDLSRRSKCHEPGPMGTRLATRRQLLLGPRNGIRYQGRGLSASTRDIRSRRQPLHPIFLLFEAQRSHGNHSGTMAVPPATTRLSSTGPAAGGRPRRVLFCGPFKKVKTKQDYLDRSPMLQLHHGIRII